jgi:hypothetical protein
MPLIMVDLNYGHNLMKYSDHVKQIKSPDNLLSGPRPAYPSGCKVSVY